MAETKVVLNRQSDLIMTNAIISGQETTGSTASGLYAVAQGNQVFASGDYSHAEGGVTVASADYTHAEGFGTTSMVDRAHAEGYYTTANGVNSHAEGWGSIASGDTSHAEGIMTLSIGYGSHSENVHTLAIGDNSHAEGYYTTASGYVSHAQGIGTIAAGEAQDVSGKFNVSGTTQLAIIGNGTDDNNRSNLAEFFVTGITVSDNVRLTAQPSGLTNFDDYTLITKKYVDDAINSLETGAFQRLSFSGSVDGTNAVFVVTTGTLVSAREQVFLNGVLQEPGASADYTIAGNTITFLLAPEAGSKVLIYGDI